MINMNAPIVAELNSMFRLKNNIKTAFLCGQRVITLLPTDFGKSFVEHQSHDVQLMSPSHQYKALSSSSSCTSS